VPVRAGLISRISGIHFDDFSRRFLRPLEHIVMSYKDKYSGDFMYTARHQRVAELVFDQVLGDQENRFNQVVRVLRHLNTDYSSDEQAFRQLIRGRSVSETFESLELGRRIFDVAQETAGENAHVLQQRGIFEMTHAGGSLDLAASFIEEAAALLPHDRTIQHSQAQVARERALRTSDPLYRMKLRERAREQLVGLVGGNSEQPHGYHTKALLALDDMRDILKEIAKAPSDLLERRLVASAREADEAIWTAQQMFPSEDRFLTVEAQFRESLSIRTTRPKMRCEGPSRRIHVRTGLQ
jgi:hypothetical protein